MNVLLSGHGLGNGKVCSGECTYGFEDLVRSE